jgi:hypothetical protein
MRTNEAQFVADASTSGWSASATGLPMVLDCAGLNVATVQAQSIGATAWSTAVLTVYRSNVMPGSGVYALETVTTITAPGISAALDVSAFRYLIVSKTTTQSGVSIQVNLYAQE